MSASREQREHAVEKAAMVFRIVKQASELGHECPTNEMLAARVGYQSTSGPVNALDFLAANGMIEIERMADSRVVTICATGKRTAGRAGKPHWSARTNAGNGGSRVMTADDITNGYHFGGARCRLLQARLDYVKRHGGAFLFRNAPPPAPGWPKWPNARVLL